jgi:hypothetical protein
MQNFGAEYFLLFFATLWFAVTTLLGVMSNWFVLAQRYPDRKEEALLTLRGQSGSMGLGVRMNHILKISVCPSGLRIGMSRVFGPFCRDFFVPWEAKGRSPCQRGEVKLNEGKNGWGTRVRT